MEQFKVEMQRVGLTMEVDREQAAMALKTWRLRSNLTQAEVAERWGMSRYTILRAECGRAISWQMAYRIFAKLTAELEREKSV